MSEFDINVGDAWKKVTQAHVNIDDTWKKINKGYVNVGDAWKLFYSSWTPPTTYVTITQNSIGDKPGLDTPSLTTTDGDTWFKIVGDGDTAKVIVCAVQSDSTGFGSGSVIIYDNSGSILTSNDVSLNSKLFSFPTTNGSNYWIKFTSSFGTANYVAVMYTKGIVYGGVFVSPLEASSYVASSLTNGRKYYTCAMSTNQSSYRFFTDSSNASYGYFSAGRNTIGGWSVSNQAYTTNSNNRLFFASGLSAPQIEWVYIDCTQGGTFPFFVM